MIAPNEMTSPLDMTLDELRAALAPLIPGNAAFDGWSDQALAMAAAELGVPAERARLAFPGGALEMIDAWFDAIDRAMASAWPLERVEQLKIRERIRTLILDRIAMINPHKEALRRAFAILALPQNAMAGARLAWRAAARMWRRRSESCIDRAPPLSRCRRSAPISLASLKNSSVDAHPARDS